MLYNQYTTTTSTQSSTDFGSCITYFESLYQVFQHNPDVYIGETGYSSFFGLPNEVNVVHQVYGWLTGQYDTYKKCVPLFIFEAFDGPSNTPAYEQKYGLFEDDPISNLPKGLKKGIVLPGWTTD